MLKNLLKGEATGTSLFLGLCSAIIAAGILQLAIGGSFVGNPNTDRWYGDWSSLLGGLFLLSVWQGILLIPTRWKRICWGAAFFFAALLAFVVPSIPWDEDQIWNYFLGAHILHGTLLIGVRRRVWMWFAIAILLNLCIQNLPDLRWTIYREVSSYALKIVPWNLLIRELPAYAFGQQIVFGVVAAFLMPPIKKSLQSVPNHEKTS